MRWPARRAAAAGVVLLLLAACSKDEPKAQNPGATLGTAAPTTTTTNPYAVPAIIDAAYVNRVLAGLDAANGDVLRTVMAVRTLTPELIDRLKAIYASNSRFAIQVNLLQEESRRGFAAYLGSPGNLRTTVVDLLSASSSCVFAKVDRDYSAVVKSPSPVLKTQWVAIRHLEPNAVRDAYNTTGWGLIYEGVEPNLQAPSVNPCTAA